MSTKTLGGYLEAVDRKRKNRSTPTPLTARANVYAAMGHYITWAEELTRTEGTEYAQGTSALLGHLIYTLGVDARTTLPEAKVRYLMEYPLEEDMPRHEPTQERMEEALRATWGADDRFIGHLSGGLFGSYMKALTTLKPHARALGRDLSECARDYLKGL